MFSCCGSHRKLILAYVNFFNSLFFSQRYLLFRKSPSCSAPPWNEKCRSWIENVMVSRYDLHICRQAKKKRERRKTLCIHEKLSEFRPLVAALPWYCARHHSSAISCFLLCFDALLIHWNTICDWKTLTSTPFDLLKAKQFSSGWRQQLKAVDWLMFA